MLIPLGVFAVSGAGASLAPDWIGQFSGTSGVSYRIQLIGSTLYGTQINNTTGSGRGYLYAMNTNGTINWQRVINGPAAYKVVNDLNNNLYVNGYDESTPNYKGYVAKYNTSGTIQWKKSQAVSGYGWESYSLGVSTNVMNGNISTGGSHYNGSAFLCNVIQYDTDGNVAFNKQITGSNFFPTGIAGKSNGDIFVCGYNAFSTNGAYLIRLNTSGTTQSQISLGPGVYPTDAGGIVTDSSDNVYMTGKCSVGGQQAIFLAKFDSSGSLLWQRTISSATMLYDGGIGISSDGFIYVTGLDNGSGIQHAIVVKYDSSGAVQWQRTLKNSAAQTWGLTVTADSSSVYISGQNTRWLARFPADGSKLGAYPLSGNTWTWAAGSYTTATGTMSTGSPGLGNTSGSLTSGTSTITESAGTMTFTKTA